MTWVAVAVGGATLVGSVYSANQQKGATKDAANASNAATQATIAEQQREFDINQKNQAPWLTTGKSALSMLGGMYGLNSDGSGQSTGAKPDYSAFYQSPDYQFALQQGLQSVDRGAAARGTLYSGQNTADEMKFGQGLASQQFGNFYNRLAGLAGIGQTAANQLGYAGQNMANQVGYANQWNAQNQMNSIYNRANANTNMVNSLTGIGSNLAGYYMNRPQTPPPSAGSFNSLTGQGTYYGPSSMNTGDWGSINAGSFYGGGSLG